MFPEIMRDEVFRLETCGMWLRWPRMADAERIAELVRVPEVALMTARIPHPYPEGEALRFIRAARVANAAGTGLSLAMTRHGETDSPIGMIGCRFRADGTPIVGFFVGRPYWGKGYASQALRAVVACVFKLTSASTIVAGALTINPASRRVQEKCGFAFEGNSLEDFPARGAKLPVDRMRLDRTTWSARHGWTCAPAAAAAVIAAGSACP